MFYMAEFYLPAGTAMASVTAQARAGAERAAEGGSDVAFVEAARNLAQRVLVEAGGTAEERLTLAFRLVLARRPSTAEMRVLRAGLEQHLADYRKDRDAARRLVGQGESRPNGKLDVAELAAYTTVAGLILNLDETITKE